MQTDYIYRSWPERFGSNESVQRMLSELAWGGCVLRMVLQVRQNMLEDTAHHCGEGPWLHTLEKRVADHFCFCLSQGGHLQQRLPVRKSWRFWLSLTSEMMLLQP